MILGTAIQVAYATNDLDEACRRFQARYGVGRFLTTGAMHIPLDSGVELVMETAHAWIGDTWLELIRPVSGDGGLYADWLPRGSGFAMRHHHHGIMISDEAVWDAKLKEAEAQSLPIVLSLTRGASRVRYYDTAQELGHYIELLFNADPSTALVSQIPR